MWTCPNCETLNEGEFCVVCGEKYEENKYESQTTVKMDGRYVGEENECHVCGSGNSGEAIYCWKCGTKLGKMKKAWPKILVAIILLLLILITVSWGSCDALLENEEEATEYPYYDDYSYEEATEEAVCEEATAE